MDVDNCKGGRLLKLFFEFSIFSIKKNMTKQRYPCCRNATNKLQALPKGWESTSIAPCNNSKRMYQLLQKSV